MRPEEKLFDAITGIDEELVDSAQNYVFRKQPRKWQRAASLAACLLIVASIGFGLLQMASLGGMGGSDSAANTTGDAAAPEDSADGGNAGGAGDDSLLGNAGNSDGGTDTTTGDSSDQEGAQAASTIFTAMVLEVGDSYLLVEPVAGDPMLATADRIQVPTGDVILPDGVTPGAVLTITFSGGVMESYPAQISGVTEIVLADG